MDDQGHTQSEQEDMTERRQRRARLFLVLSPVAFVFCWIFARAQDASHRDALIIAAASFVMCLFFSVHYRLRGERASGDMFSPNFLFHLFRKVRTVHTRPSSSQPLC
ncbi:hypothetical protein V1291_000675 [Nitrobacteraceae bacterium AZCC 1564]